MAAEEAPPPPAVEEAKSETVGPATRPARFLQPPPPWPPHARSGRSACHLGGGGWTPSIQSQTGPRPALEAIGPLERDWMRKTG